MDGNTSEERAGKGVVIAIKIKDAEVKAAEIAANAVGSSEIATDAMEASELKRVTKLIFAECTFNAFSSIGPGNAVLQNCAVNGVATDDNVVATKNAGHGCFKIVTAQANSANNIFIIWRNDSGTNQSLGVGEVSVIAYNM